jgi:hypothetical protein
VSITIISNHQPPHKLPKIAESLPRTKPTISDRNTPKLLFTLRNAERIIAHYVNTAGSVGLLIHAAHDFVHLAGRGDVFCAIRVGARYCRSNRFRAGRRTRSFDNGDCQGAFGSRSRRTGRHDSDSGRRRGRRISSLQRAADRSLSCRRGTSLRARFEETVPPRIRSRRVRAPSPGAAVIRSVAQCDALCVVAVWE